MKCASTYVADTLRRSFGAQVGNRDIAGYYFPAEQNLTYELLEQLRGKTFALNLHLRPYPHNLDALARERISVVCLWRNLGDVVISFDDHIRRESELNPIFFVADRERYLAMSSEARYNHLIDSIVPWNLGFYLAWRRQSVPLFPYEELVRSSETLFERALHWLAPAVGSSSYGSAVPPSDDTRLNVGVVGRSENMLSHGNRRRLERLVLDHPQRHELEVLLWELPWAVPALEPRGPCDGMIVGCHERDDLYFVSRGTRHYIPHPTWILSRRIGDVKRLDACVLDGIPIGEPMI